MSEQQIIAIIMKKLDENSAKLSKHDDLITNILITLGSMKVKVAMIVGIFSTIGGVLTAIILKFVLNF